jgi:DNA-binding NtrC family response regulator
MKFKILIIDDEKSIRDIFTLLLEDKGYGVESAATAAEGLSKTAEFRPDALLLDMNLPDRPGIEVLSRVREILPACRILIITAFGTIRNAVEAVKLGAYAYLEKPVDNEELLLVIGRALEVRKLESEVEDLRTELVSRYSFDGIVGTSARMNSVFQMMHRIARVDGTVLITGESGTGKELVARAVHFAGSRKNSPFVVVNCGAIPRDLIESEFFGHSKGAFTDAKSETTGKFEMAHTGTIFLDEIGDLSADAQVKLLRVLGEKEIVKVGGTKTIPVDVRVIAATNKDLEAEVKKGNFREDLYFRLAVLSIRLPPLREREEDIPLLGEHFVKKFNAELGKSVRGISGEALRQMKEYPWPGNVRELENVVYESMVMSDASAIEERDLPLRIVNWRGEAEELCDAPSEGPAKPMNSAIQDLADRTERKMIEEALRATGGNRTRAAQILGISRKTLFNKMAAHGIRAED